MSIYICNKFDSHATLPLRVGPPELGLIEAVDTLCAVLLNQTACAVSTAPGTDSPAFILTQDLPSEPAAPPPPPPLEVRRRDNPIPALISDVVIIICHIWRRETERMGKRATNIPFQTSLSACGGRTAVCRRHDRSNCDDWRCLNTHLLVFCSTSRPGFYSYWLPAGNL